MDNKNVFSCNLRRYMALHGKTRREICEALGFSYYTFSDWANGKKYPRMDKVEMLANYFGIQKSDLIEEKEQATSKSDLSKEDRELLERFHDLPENLQSAILAIMDSK